MKISRDGIDHGPISEGPESGGARAVRGPLAAAALLAAFLGGLGAALAAGVGAPASGAGLRLLDSLNALISTFTLIALLWGLHFHRQEVRLKLREEGHRLLSLRQELEGIQRQSRIQARQAALLAVGTYVQSRQEARASFAKSRLSSRARERVLRANRFCSEVLDEILREAGSEPWVGEEGMERPEEGKSDREEPLSPFRGASEKAPGSPRPPARERAAAPVERSGPTELCH